MVMGLYQLILVMIVESAGRCRRMEAHRGSALLAEKVCCQEIKGGWELLAEE